MRKYTVQLPAGTGRPKTPPNININIELNREIEKSLLGGNSHKVIHYWENADTTHMVILFDGQIGMATIAKREGEINVSLDKTVTLSDLL